MPNPPFTPLTLSRKQLEFLASIANESQTGVANNYRLLLRECEAQAHAAADLKQRLEETLIERDRETEVRRKAEAHVRDMQAYCDRMPYPDEYDDMERQLKAETARASQAEAALEEMRKQVNEFAQWLEVEAAAVDTWHSHAGGRLRHALAELQRRRSPTGQEHD